MGMKYEYQKIIAAWLDKDIVYPTTSRRISKSVFANWLIRESHPHIEAKIVAIDEVSTED